MGKGPGAMALKRTPRLPHSAASDWVITLSPALDIADGTVNGPPDHTQVVRIETTDAFLLLGQPALAGVQRDEERAAEDDVGDGVEAARSRGPRCG